MKAAAAVAVWLTVAVLAFFAWASLRGFDPAMCDAYASCDWRRA